ncbi:anthranilate synthase component II [uncultured Hymenobacter sp.]|uniref:anthranilate synthase component II n=1 Tax=uncultured Hymenobacter sp. TaxID=170016 RepID=UPI0035CB2B2D
MRLVKILLLDNFDSFTFTLADYLRQLGAEVLVRRNDVPLAELRQLDFEAVVLSPGPGTPREAGTLLAVIAAYHQQVPMLGVCLGHQALGQYFGATLRRAARPMHGKVSEMEWEGEGPLFAGLPRRLAVTRYHSLVLADELPPVLEALAYTTGPAPELMALRHRTLPLAGVQFHPEALLTTHGRVMLANWVRSCNIVKTGARELS